MALEQANIANWVDAYEQAWRTAGTDHLTELFTRDATYQMAPFEEANRGLLESMIAEPERYRWVRVAAEDVGERPCQHWHSRPRWGILGMLLGWWRVKHSSGCPLATGLAAPALAR